MSRASSTTNEDLYYYDVEAGERPIRFMEKYLRHIEGRKAGQPLLLLEWEKNCIRHIFGWKHRATGLRRYRVAYIEIPRKNGKSTLAAGLALYLMFADRERGAQVYSAASDRFQARIVFSIAKQMFQTAHRSLRKRGKPYKNSILAPDTFNSYQVLSRDAFNKHGLNAHGIIFDELHTQTDRDLYDVLHTSTGAREQPIEILITTAGHDKTSLCYEFHETAMGILDGTLQDDSFFPCVYGLDEETEDWRDPEMWKLVNPSLGEAISLEYLQQECRKAIRVLSYQNTFKRLHCNMWTQQEHKWIDMDLWDGCNHPVDPVELEGCRCYAGLDLASKKDLCAFVLVFPPQEKTNNRYAFLPFFWMPEDNVEARVKKNRVKYDTWVTQGLIKPTGGKRADYGVIREDILELAERYDIREIALDRWNATQIHTELEDEGLVVAEFGQGTKSMKDPTSELEVLLLDGDVAHGGHDVLRWMANNVMVNENPAGDRKPDKKASGEKIDGIVAAIMGIGRAMVAPPEDGDDEEAGMEVIG